MAKQYNPSEFRAKFIVAKLRALGKSATMAELHTLDQEVVAAAMALPQPPIEVLEAKVNGDIKWLVNNKVFPTLSAALVAVDRVVYKAKLETVWPDCFDRWTSGRVALIPAAIGYGMAPLFGKPSPEFDDTGKDPLAIYSARRVDGVLERVDIVGTHGNLQYNLPGLEGDGDPEITNNDLLLKEVGAVVSPRVLTTFIALLMQAFDDYRIGKTSTRTQAWITLTGLARDLGYNESTRRNTTEIKRRYLRRVEADLNALSKLSCVLHVRQAGKLEHFLCPRLVTRGHLVKVTKSGRRHEELISVCLGMETLWNDNDSWLAAIPRGLVKRPQGIDYRVWNDMVRTVALLAGYYRAQLKTVRKTGKPRVALISSLAKELHPWLMARDPKKAREKVRSAIDLALERKMLTGERSGRGPTARLTYRMASLDPLTAEVVAPKTTLLRG